VAGLFCLLWQVLASSDKGSVSFSDYFCYAFQCFSSVLGIAGMFCLSLTSFEAPAKFRHVSGKNLTTFFLFFIFYQYLCFSAKLIGLYVYDRLWCFAARTDPKLLLIDVSDRPWCFAARSDQIFVVQVFNEFSTGHEGLLNYLVICFKSLYCVLQSVSA
jgi:hypothetical protein